MPKLAALPLSQRPRKIRGAIIIEMGVILFDIDGTLFDPKKFGSLYRAGLIEALRISEDDLASAIADYYSTLESSTDFDPEGLILFLSNRYGAEKELISDIFWKPSYFLESRFGDAKDAVKRASEQNSVGVFSQGLRSYQEYKLEHADIEKYLDPKLILIYRSKVAEEALASIPRGAVVIEDKHDVALALSKVTKTVWLNRMSEEKDPEIETIHSLTKLQGNI